MTNYSIQKEELPRVAGAQYAIGDQWRRNYKMSEGVELDQKQHPFADMTGDGMKSEAVKSNVA